MLLASCNSCVRNWNCEGRGFGVCWCLVAWDAGWLSTAEDANATEVPIVFDLFFLKWELKFMVLDICGGSSLAEGIASVGNVILMGMLLCICGGFCGVLSEWRNNPKQVLTGPARPGKPMSGPGRPGFLLRLPNVCFFSSLFFCPSKNGTFSAGRLRRQVYNTTKKTPG